MIIVLVRMFRERHILKDTKSSYVWDRTGTCFIITSLSLK